MSFVFYDTETTGTNTAFDQILQFGAIRTDPELREVDRFEIRCRLLPHVVSSPKGLLANGIGVQQLTDPALPSHYEMVRAIRAKLEEWSPAVFVGHNSMRFDEHLLRQAFYQTLHPPYLSNTKGNGRMDVLTVLQAASFLEPDVLTVPASEKSRPTFSLERLAPANGFAHDAAHDAMGDTEATLYLCRLVRERVEGVWSNCVRFARKAAVLDYAQPGEVFAFVGFSYGRAYLRMVTAIGPNPERDSDLYVFDLSCDPHELAALNDDRLRANAAPCILSYEDVPAWARVQLPGVEELGSRAEYVREDRDLRQRLMAVVVEDREEREPSVHVGEQIYDSFTGSEDQALMAAFHEAEWPSRAALLGRLADARLQVLGERLLYTEAPDAMPAEGLTSYRVDMARRLMAGEGTVPWLVLPKAIRETDELLASSTGGETSLLRRLRDYLVRRSEEAQADDGFTGVSAAKGGRACMSRYSTIYVGFI